MRKTLLTEAGSTNWFAIAMLLLAVLVLGVGAAYTMQATDQARFCGSCHVMEEAAMTHKRSLHAKLACNECHAPYDLAAKIPFKMESGSSDIKDNTFKNFHDVILAGKAHKDVINANCMRCHAPAVQKVAMDSKPYCVDCHRSIPHKRSAPISSRKVADG